MNVIIGGPPSTGSSLLVRILNRHSDLYANPTETHLFTKLDLYRSWNKYKNRILLRGIRGLRSPGWFMYNGINLDTTTYHRSQIEELISRSTTFPDFVDEYYLNILNSNNKKFWVEKTPANVLCFSYLEEIFRNIHLVATIRDPFDIIVSQVNRGLSIYNAVAVTLTNYVFVSDDHCNLSVIKFEELRNNPNEILTSLCNELNIRFENDMLKPDGRNVKMDGWQHSETGSIIASNESTFDNSPLSIKNEICKVVAAMKINKKWRSKINITTSFSSIEDICHKWGYAYRKTDKHKPSLRTEMICDKWTRTKRGYPTHFLNYPVEIVNI